jgi:hypothetical protein
MITVPLKSAGTAAQFVETSAQQSSPPEFTLRALDPAGPMHAQFSNPK